MSTPDPKFFTSAVLDFSSRLWQTIPLDMSSVALGSFPRAGQPPAPPRPRALHR